jgi:hypothetical protein
LTFFFLATSGERAISMLCLYLGSLRRLGKGRPTSERVKLYAIAAQGLKTI